MKCTVCEREFEHYAEPDSCPICGDGPMCPECAEECEELHQEEVFD